jgi:hypothetical protein
MFYEAAVVVLLAVICFLLYRLYRIKYTGRGEKTEFVPENIRRDLADLGEHESKEAEMRLRDIDKRISDLERKVEKNEGVIEKLIEDLG